MTTSNLVTLEGVVDRSEDDGFKLARLDVSRPCTSSYCCRILPFAPLRVGE